MGGDGQLQQVWNVIKTINIRGVDGKRKLVDAITTLRNGLLDEQLLLNLAK